MIEASAPGKLVLTGEYAVLKGAPALVAGVDRRVTCRLDITQAGGWAFESKGFDAASSHTLESLLSGPCPTADDPAELMWHVLRYLAPRSLPPHLNVEIDSTACYLNGNKLGLGSSAAAVVALGSAIAKLTERSVTLEDLLAIHHASQGGSGSGLDVATAYHGHVVRFSREGGRAKAAPVALPEGLHWQFVYAGFSTKTSVMLEKFDAYVNAAATRPLPLDRLIDQAHRVADAVHSADAFLAALEDYIGALVELDQAGAIGILPEPQMAARSLAHVTGVLYKPCGAGGGDMGVAVTMDGNRLAAFGERIGHAGFTVVPMEITRHGVRVSGD